MTGNIRVKPNVYKFGENEAEFDDGSVEEIDAIIFATGFDYKIQFVSEEITKIDKNETKLYKHVYPPHLKHPTLGVVGLVQAIGAVMPISEMQCRWFTRVLKGIFIVQSLDAKRMFNHSNSFGIHIAHLI